MGVDFTCTFPDGHFSMKRNHWHCVVRNYVCCILSRSGWIMGSEGLKFIMNFQKRKKCLNVKNIDFCWYKRCRHNNPPNPRKQHPEAPRTIKVNITTLIVNLRNQAQINPPIRGLWNWHRFCSRGVLKAPLMVGLIKHTIFD